MTDHKAAHIAINVRVTDDYETFDCTLYDLISSNEWDDGEDEALVDAILDNREYRLGGGAAPLVIVTRI